MYGYIVPAVRACIAIIYSCCVAIIYCIIIFDLSAKEL